LAEELWQKTGHEYSIHNQSWPGWDKELAKDEEITLVIQVNGKLRDRLTISASSPTDEYVELAKQSERIQSYLEGKEIVKTICVPGTVNFVVK
jgi:leucyl-tRNA synthetase